MMLMQLGKVPFEVHPFNAERVDHDHSTDFVAKPVAGAPEPLEYVGEGAETWQIRGRMLPAHLGGMQHLESLTSARKSGRPQYLVRGDGKVLGWVVILGVRERGQWLDPEGVPQVIDIDIDVRRSARPSASILPAILGGIFA